MKKIYAAKYTVKEEYRKHVTLITDFLKVDVELLKEYFERTKEYIQYLDEIKKK